MADLQIDDLMVGDRPITKLVEELEEMFPPINPLPQHSIESIMYRAGARSVVEYIQEKLQDK